MTDRVHPSAKPTTAAAAAAHQPPSQQPPPPKPHLYNPSRHPYRPTPAYLAQHNRRRCGCRRFCFLCICWTLLFLIFILLLSCIASTILYFLYNPKRPSFSISSLKISQFNLTTTPLDESTRLSTKLNLTLSCKNPNKKVVFFYNPISINIYSMHNEILLANGSFPEFTSIENNVTIIHTTLAMSNQVMDADSVRVLRSDLKKKSGVPIKLVVETKVKVKMDKIKVRKFDIVVTCEGIHGQMPKGKIAGTATTTKAKCKVDPKFKIWKVTF
ncbi:hypothetical protein LIER_10865 [Lithospermum erythrorhizon]|uniref:Late embryogenesis abundant protein LEA-2 subgroup domain-containing protein n=1 Tax=Lithospermum erythrorhizon TaxID=34254 RepID=A0AAV3PM61_LITER